MLKGYLSIAWRTLRRRPGYTFINVFGLALGMVACLLIGLYVRDELSHDTFHAKADRIVAIGVESTLFFDKGQTASYPLGNVLAASVPGVEEVVRTRGDAQETTVRRVEGSFEREQRVLVADSTFFEVFSFPLVRGSPAAVLDAPRQAVITEAMANVFFGTQNLLGRSLSFELGGEMHTVTVAGVAEAPPSTSTLQFDVVVPAALVSATERANWGALRWSTYALLDQPMEADAFTQRMQRAVAPHKKGNYMFSRLDLHAVPLPELYLSDYHEASGFSGQRRYIYLFSTIALLILLVAAINYVNLVTAQGQRRAKEVGVRKTVGAQREQLAVQFLGETALLSLLALAVALALAGAALPGFNALMGTRLSLAAAWSTWALPGLAAFVLVVSVAAGAYPAFVLSGFRPVEVLRGRVGGGSGKGGWLRRGLVVAQFAVSAGLMLCAAVMYAQLRFVQTKSLGFEGEQVVTVDLPVDTRRRQRQQVIKRRVLSVPGVEGATMSSGVPGAFNVEIGNATENISLAARTEREDVSFRPATVDVDYVETLGLKLLAGRSFRTGRPADRTRGYVLNEAAVKEMGWTVEEAVGKPFNYARGQEAPTGSVIGVVENFHIESLRDPIAPVVLLMEASRFSASTTILTARLAPGQIGMTMDRIQHVVRAQLPGATFSYTFLNDRFDAMYRSERRVARIFAVFAGIAIVVACLGLFGLAAFAAERRTKEIAIRKAMGASVMDVARLVSREFALLVGVALAVGMPLAYWFIQQWLEGFAYRTASSAWMFVLTAAATLLIAVGSTSYHAVRAALTNPARALRDE